jgi:hypothetical protein
MASFCLSEAAEGKPEPLRGSRSRAQNRMINHGEIRLILLAFLAMFGETVYWAPCRILSVLIARSAVVFTDYVSRSIAFSMFSRLLKALNRK